MTSPIALHALRYDIYRLNHSTFPCTTPGGCTFVTTPGDYGYNYVLVLTPNAFNQVAHAIGINPQGSFAPIYLEEENFSDLPESLHATIDRLIPGIHCRMKHVIVCCSDDAERFIKESTAITTKEH